MTTPEDIVNIRREYGDYPDRAVRELIMRLCDSLGSERSVPNPAEWDEMVTRSETCERQLNAVRGMLLRVWPELWESAGGSAGRDGWSTGAKQDSDTEGEE